MGRWRFVLLDSFLPDEADGVLLATLAHHKYVRTVVWGHVHQASDREHEHLRLLSTPSTCAQFTPHTERCVVDTRWTAT